MKTYIRIEITEHSLAEKIIEKALALEQRCNRLTESGAFGGESIADAFHVVIRIYPEERFKSFPKHYKPIAKRGRKVKGALITQDIFLSELNDANDELINARLLNCVVNAIMKLPELKVADVKIDELIESLNKAKQ